MLLLNNFVEILQNNKNQVDQNDYIYEYCLNCNYNHAIQHDPND